MSKEHSIGEKKGTDHSVYDSESVGYQPPAPTLKRQLKNRHVAMISIGGVIGTGLFLGTANSLRLGGPIGLLLGYFTVGTICYSVMITLGEMISYLPIAGGHIKLAERFVDPALSFTMGWNYWYNWVIVLPAELSAAAVLVDYWDRNSNLNPAWISICMLVIILINFLGAGAYGEAEFAFASIKVITIVGLIILGIVLDLGGGPNHDRLGFRYWKNPGPFVQYDGITGAKGRFLGWWAVLTQAAFSFIGTEIVAIAAGEAKNPRRNIPKAIRRVYIRILLFYIGGVIIVGLLVPSNLAALNLGDGTGASSPFVIAIQRSGIKVLPSIINAAFLSSAWSAASSDMFTSSRALYGLAISGNAPRIFGKTLKNGLPIYSLLVSAAFALLSYMAASKGAGNVFNWFANMTSIAGLMTWFGIGVTYLRFYEGMKAQGIDRKSLPFWTRLQPFAAWYTVISTIIICFFSGWAVFLRGKWDTATFVTNYLPLALFPLLYICSRLYFRQGPVAPEKMDFVSGIAEIEAESWDEPPPKNGWERFWAWLM
ncbi:amino acid permease [Vararia minispora EC-137]|uniref:Amino acid permease n=1 Tax=Vararia minispora EC-137 TaxID=1314806 RepID=A0ACB8QYF3_9AGAM|nr:amino acid permease [Vararia minispora EC-137]